MTLPCPRTRLLSLLLKALQRTMVMATTARITHLVLTARGEGSVDGSSNGSGNDAPDNPAVYGAFPFKADDPKMRATIYDRREQRLDERGQQKAPYLSSTFAVVLSHSLRPFSEEDDQSVPYPSEPAFLHGYASDYVASLGQSWSPGLCTLIEVDWFFSTNEGAVIVFLRDSGNSILGR
ncbi:hypothetical protein GGR55DRAFT_131813 [Xylaria sp. FL0064]|nr:hypothetical protein GGR55DRAFT_131813 [Xylaria sp. FL0064]